MHIKMKQTKLTAKGIKLIFPEKKIANYPLREGKVLNLAKFTCAIAIYPSAYRTTMHNVLIILRLPSESSEVTACSML